MARREALLRLHKSLVSRRDELRKHLGGELKDLRNFKADPTGDSADSQMPRASPLAAECRVPAAIRLARAEAGPAAAALHPAPLP